MQHHRDEDWPQLQPAHREGGRDGEACDVDDNDDDDDDDDGDDDGVSWEDVNGVNHTFFDKLWMGSHLFW